MRRIILFRHGETDWNAAERAQGQLDIPLNEKGRVQARELALRLLTEGIGAILSSDLSRAVETARIVAETLRVPVLEDPALREAHMGAAQGLTHEEIAARFGAETVRRWRSGHFTDADVFFEGGETGVEIRERALSAIERFARVQTHEVLGVATHGGVMRRIAQYLGKGEEPLFIGNAGIVEIELRWEPARFRLLPGSGPGE